MAGRSREYDIAFRLNGLMDASFRQSMGNAERHIEELERALRTMNSRGDLDELRRDADRADRSLNNLGDSARGFGKTLRQVAEYTGAFALIEGAGASLQNIVGVISDQSDAMAQLQAATGATSGEMQGMWTSVESLYATDRLGEDFNDIANSMATVRQVSKATGDELERMTRNAIVYRDVFGEEITQSIKASDTMMKNFGITSDQSFSLLAQGAQKGLNKSDELIDTANEYSVYYKTLGYSAQEMFDQFAAGLEAGAFNLDKVGDAVKEFGIRIKDGSKATSDALAALFAPDNIVAWTEALRKGGTKSEQYMELVGRVGKQTAKQMLSDLKKGGKSASDTFTVLQSTLGDGQNILDGLSNGSIKGRDAMQKVIEKLNEIQDPIERSTLGVALFGTQFEDMESGVIAALGTAREQFDMTKQTMDEIAAVKYDTVGKDFQQIGRQLMTELIIPLSEDLMPVLKDFAAWLGNNKDLVKVIALGVPAAILAKNTVKIVRNLLKIETAAAGAGGAARGFGGAAALLTNPVGITVAAVGALTLGVIAYKKHQEQARQELIHMGDALDGAFNDYNQIENQTERTKELITEYDRLTTKIENVETPAAQLTEARRKLAKVEQELIELNPDILRAEDAKTDRFREQLGIADRLNETNREMAKRELETKVRNGESQLDSLEDEYQRLMENKEKYDRAYVDAKNAYAQYAEFANQQQAIVADDSLTPEEQNMKLSGLAKEVEASTGKNYRDNWLAFMLDMNDMLKKADSNFENWKQSTEEIAASENSFSELYEAQKKLIEMNLGGKLEDQAKNFNSLSSEEKSRFNAALKSVEDLNREMDRLPNEKKINLEMLYTASGQAVPESLKPSWPFQKSAIEKQPDYTDISWMLPRFGEGGISSGPSIFGEAGPEIAIPLNNKPRSHDLLNVANQMMGRDGGSDVSVTFAPKITIQGGGDVSAQSVKQAMAEAQDEFERRFLKMMERQRLVRLR